VLRERQDVLRAEYKDVERRIARLTGVLETDESAGVRAIVDKLRILEDRRREITSELEALQPVPRLPRQIIQGRLDEWRRLLRASTTQGRAVLQRILCGRITFTPRPPDPLATDGYDFFAPTRFDKLFCGLAVKRPASLAYTTDGCGIMPEDTCERDYGMLLERVYGKRIASPTGFEPVFWP
jgi:hypothetical protein